MEKAFPKKPNGKLHRLLAILIRGLVVCVIFLFLYFYLPRSKSIYTFLYVYGIGDPYSSVDPEVISPETEEILIGLLTSFLVFILIPVLSILIAWKNIRKVNSHLRKKYKYQRLESRHSVETSIPGNIFIRDSYNAPGDLKDLFESGKESYAAGNYQEAINRFSEAINLCSNYKAYYNRGILYYKIGEKKKAVNDFKEAAKLGHEKSQNILTSSKIAW